MRPAARTLATVYLILCPSLCGFLCAPAVAQTVVPGTPGAAEGAAPPATPLPDADTAPAAPPVTVTRIDITGNTLIPTEDLRAVVTLKPGDAYTRDLYLQSVDAIQKLYADRGFQAVVAPEASTIAADGVVSFPITEAVVESIVVRGNKKTKRGTILRVIETRPGELYRRDRAQEDVRALFNLGIFNDITYRLEPGSALGKVQMVYVVDEAKTGQVAAGLSYSGSSGIIGQVEVIETNLGGQANVLGAYIQSGGKFYRSGFQLSFHDPFITSNRTALDLGVYAKTVYRFSGNDIFQSQFEQGTGYDEFRTGGDVSLSRRLGNNLRAALGFRGNGVKARYSYDVFLPDTGGEGGTGGTFVTDLRNPGIPDGNIFAGTAAVANDRRDYALDPARGGIQVAALEVGHVRTDAQTFRYSVDPNTGTVLTTDVPGDSGGITRLSVDLREYFSHGRTEAQPTRAVPVFAGRLVAGTVTGTVPFWEQFFVGGIGLGGVQYARFLTTDAYSSDPFVTSSQALRGYREGRFWGKSMLVGSLEYRIPLGQAIRGVLFVDAGDAWNNSIKLLNPFETDPKEQDNSFSLHSSVGVGLRITTPVGPIRIDFGVGSEGSRTHFSIGQVF